MVEVGVVVVVVAQSPGRAAPLLHSRDRPGCLLRSLCSSTRSSCAGVYMCVCVCPCVCLCAVSVCASLYDHVCARVSCLCLCR